MRGRRSNWGTAGLLVAATLAVPAPARAQGDTAPGRQSPAPDSPEATRHFTLGVKLYQDGNYSGALAEFEAANRLKPGASSLQNVALCLKQLFRYAEAADTLEKLLKQYGVELSDDQKKSVQSAIDELSSLVGSIAIAVTPADASVTVDGKPVEAAARGSVRLNVGEHTVVADAPGYQRVTRVIRVAGGQTRVPVELELQPITGFVSVQVDDNDAAIAIDGKALAFHSWRGPLEPGRHYVQVYKKGFKTYEQVLNIQVGQTENVIASLAPLPPGEASKANDDAPPRQLRGWYGLAVLDLLGLDGAPDGIEQGGAQEQRGGVDVGVRAGYRLWTPVGVELMLEGGRHEVKDACVREGDLSCDANYTRSYTLSSFRLGPAVRIMSGGEKVRFTSAIGTGAVQHQLAYKAVTVPANPTATPTSPLRGAETAQGWDPFFMLEVGAQFNWGHVLLEANVTAYLDAASSVQSGTWSPYHDTGGLKMIGLGLRAGWGEWTPDDAPKAR